MFRMITTVGTIIGYAAFATTKINYIEKHKQMIKDVHEQDAYAQLMAKNWANQILKTAGVTYTVSGHNIDLKEPVLFVSNHEGNFDIPVLISALEQPFGFVSKVEVKEIPFLDRWMQLLNCIYLDRSNRRASLQMIKDGVQSLQAGHSLLIFPEGHRSKGKGLGEFKAGSIKLAKSAKVKIVPVVINGTSKIMEQYDSKRMVPAHVTVEVLQAIEPEVFNDNSMQEVMDMIKARISEHVK